MDQFNDWCSSMAGYTDLQVYDGFHEPRSISVVPEKFKKSNEDAYMPRVVSIGPRFKGSREDLLLMEDVKIRCMMHLFNRTKQGVDPYQKLKSLCQVFYNMDNEIRESYVANINLEKEELTKIILVDGCFLLELLVSKGLADELPEEADMLGPSPAVHLLTDEDVLSDLTLLENQIPIYVLYVLYDTTFFDLFQHDSMLRVTRINKFIMSVLGYSLSPTWNIGTGHHILDIVHSFVNGKGEEEDHHVVVDIIMIETTQIQQQQLLVLKRCALRLLTSGITIQVRLPRDKKKRDTMEESKGLDFYFDFQEGKLEIEQLHITKTTKSKWCNIIAWEHDQSIKTRSYGGICGYGGKFTWAALIFNGLICSEDDVQLLKDKKIVVDHLKMSNLELVEFFRKIVLGVDHGVVDCIDYIQMVGGINNYSKANFHNKIWSTVRNSFAYYRHGWLLRFMNRNYNFVATVLSILTVMQTVYAILSYNFPK